MGDATDPSLALQASWQANAAAWTAAVRAGAIESRRLVTDAAIVEAALARAPRRVLDLGCGEGWLVRGLTAAGIDALGVDGAAPLIAAATAAGGGRYLQMSYGELIADPRRCGTGFDLVIANFALLDDQPGPLLQALQGCLTTEAWLLVQTLHPIAAGPPYVDGWRQEDFRGFGDQAFQAKRPPAWTPMPWYFRTLGSWLALLRDAGFTLERLREPVHPQDGRPLSLLLEARRQA